MMEFKIVSATRQLGQIEVAYFFDGKHYGTYAIDVPVVDGVFLTGEALAQEITHRAPTWALEREAAVLSALNFGEIEALIEREQTPAANTLPTNLDMWEQVAFEQKIGAALVKFGVLPADPTAVPVAEL